MYLHNIFKLAIKKKPLFNFVFLICQCVFKYLLYTTYIFSLRVSQFQITKLGHIWFPLDSDYMMFIKKVTLL